MDKGRDAATGKDRSKGQVRSGAGQHAKTETETESKRHAWRVNEVNIHIVGDGSNLFLGKANNNRSGK